MHATGTSAFSPHTRALASGNLVRMELIRRYLPLERVGRREREILIVALLIIGGVWLFIMIADEVKEGATQSFDEKVLLALRNPNDPAQPIGPHWMAEVGRDLTALGGIAVLTLVTGAVIGFLALQRRFSSMWLVLASTVGGVLLSLALKGLFDRPRPSVVPHLSIVMTTSFPSGHSMLSATVYLTLGALLARVESGWKTKIYFLVTSLILTFLVGFSRVYMGVHYPTDVLAGWTAGLCWALLCWGVARALQRRGQVEGGAE